MKFFKRLISRRTKRNNRCCECGCSCTCYGDCEGDINKCTSKKANKINCPHCCDCYIGPMAKRIFK